MSLRSPVTCETIEVCWECMGMPLYSLRNGLGWVFCKLYHKHVTHHPSLAKHGQTMSNQRNPFDMSGLLDLKKTMIKKKNKEMHDINPSVVPLDDRGFLRPATRLLSAAPSLATPPCPWSRPTRWAIFLRNRRSWGDVFFHMCPIHFYISSQFLQFND